MAIFSNFMFPTLFLLAFTIAQTNAFERTHRTFNLTHTEVSEIASECALRFSGNLEVNIFETKTTICLEGFFSPNSAKKVVGFLSKSTHKLIVVSSNGGYPIEVVQIATKIAVQEMDLIVYDKCFSACANFLFISARKKYIGKSAIVAWHGLTSPPKAIRLDGRESVEGLKVQVEVENFFEKFGFSKEPSIRPPYWTKKYKIWSNQLNSNDSAWTFSKTTLEKKFNIKDVFCFYESNSKLVQIAQNFGIKNMLFDDDMIDGCEP